jgi:3-oxoacyl-[acyl-carrier-protein] synthase-3
MAHVEIAGLASSLPEKTVTNFDLEKLMDTSDEWIRKRTGISERRIATSETTTGLAVDASRRALENAGVDRDQVGLIVACTVTGDYVTPSMASHVQRELGIESCAAMDISAGCTGFVYALVTASALMESLDVAAALVVASEELSKIADWSDRATCVLFGDGAGAVVLKRSEAEHMGCAVLSGSPDYEDVLSCKCEPHETPFSGVKPSKKEYLRMKGKEVFTYAVGAIEEVLKKLAARCGDKPFNKIIPHQANLKIIDCVIRSMRLDPKQFFLDIDKFANTSSATIPIAMCDAVSQGWLRRGDRVALVGFGSGLTCGGVVIDWTI